MRPGCPLAHQTDIRRLVLQLAGLALLLFLAYRLLVPDLPVATPVTVRGGEEAQPLSAAIEDFDPSQIVSVLSRDAIPAIDDPKLVAAEEADVGDDELVIGVEIEGEVRAYPIRVLSSHEVVNDTIRGKPIAVTW